MESAEIIYLCSPDNLCSLLFCILKMIHKTQLYQHLSRVLSKNAHKSHIGSGAYYQVALLNYGMHMRADRFLQICSSKNKNRQYLKHRQKHISDMKKVDNNIPLQYFGPKVKSAVLVYCLFLNLLLVSLCFVDNSARSFLNQHLLIYNN